MGAAIFPLYEISADSRPETPTRDFAIYFTFAVYIIEERSPKSGNSSI
jgi:hypothetical protein